jgi:ApaG protein
MGAMQGSYQMKRLVDEEIFDVKIPEFSLIAPYKLN